jgi:hypothetical protein
MSDNELLFYAAKAAGIDYSLRGQVPTRFDGKDFIVWNPLQHDGDALRLAVKLQLDVYCHEGGALVCSSINNAGFEEDPALGIYAATRRAIVRAAAEIGKEMK